MRNPIPPYLQDAAKHAYAELNRFATDEQRAALSAEEKGILVAAERSLAALFNINETDSAD